MQEEPEEKHFQAIRTLHKAYINSYAILYNIDVFAYISNIRVPINTRIHNLLFYKHQHCNVT